MDLDKYCWAEAEQNEKRYLPGWDMGSVAAWRHLSLRRELIAYPALSIKYASEENRHRSAMTRKDWQKKRKKMSGREGPKKGKNR